MAKVRRSVKKKGETFIDESFQLSQSTRNWVAHKYPQVDIEATLEKFKRKAEAEGWMYRNWQRGFEGIVERGMESGWRSIVTIKGGAKFDPKWVAVLEEARAVGFREPTQMETPAGYRTSMDNWKREQYRPSNVVRLRSA